MAGSTAATEAMRHWSEWAADCKTLHSILTRSTEALVSCCIHGVNRYISCGASPGCTLYRCLTVTNPLSLCVAFGVFLLLNVPPFLHVMLCFDPAACMMSNKAAAAATMYAQQRLAVSCGLEASLLCLPAVSHWQHATHTSVMRSGQHQGPLLFAPSKGLCNAGKQ